MKTLRHTFLIMATLAIAFLLASCGDASTTTASGNTSPTATPAPTATPTPTSDTSYGKSGGTVAIHAANATVGGNSKTILTDAKGMTLYYFTPDTPTKTACTGACATAWPPLLASGSGTPSADASLTGKITVQQTANGNQVEYNNHMLYTYVKDTAPGQTNGQGVGGKWYVATADLS
ncbi:MAG TPA: hypothetical protein VKX46_12385 [Ktedonobacteraceae bacterium]|nr:hypothetical protein [Ktedonobacteraceae bacterium]